MTTVCGPLTAVDVERAAQLINKTNQFNTTTRRLSSDDLERRIASPTDLVLQFRLLDRFGDNGLVSVMLFRVLDDPDVLLLDNWVMSCRVFGRQLEHVALNLAVEEARRRAVRSIVAEFVPTPKNGVVKELFATLGFRAMGLSGPGGASRWKLDVAEYMPHSTHIRPQWERHD
jgi:FkbH-like protein